VIPALRVLHEMLRRKSKCYAALSCGKSCEKAKLIAPADSVLRGTNLQRKPLLMGLLNEMSSTPGPLGTERLESDAEAPTLNIFDRSGFE
jgi:hypothetical protein